MKTDNSKILKCLELMLKHTEMKSEIVRHRLYKTLTVDKVSGCDAQWIFYLFRSEKYTVSLKRSPRAKPASGATLLSKSIQEILVVMLAYASPYRLCGRGRGVPRQPDGGWRMPSFLPGNLTVLFGNRRFNFLGGESDDHCRF